MWRIVLIALAVATVSASAHAQEQASALQSCRGEMGSAGPVLSDCRPIDGIIDPQERDLWILSIVDAPADPGPRALHLIGAASSEAWLNGQRLGANGRPGSDAGAESPGRYQVSFPIRDSLWRPESNTLVVHLSSFHGGHRLNRPMGMVAIGPYPFPTAIGPFAATLIATGALMAAAFGFGVIHSIRKTESSLALAGMAGVAALQATIENARAFAAYPYPLHVWRLWAIWALAATFAILLVDYVAARFWPRARREVVGTAVVLVAASLVAPGFDEKTGWALAGGVAVATLVAALGVRHRKPGAVASVAYLTVFLIVAMAWPEWLVDLSYFVLAACLVLPLLMIEVIRLGRDDSSREAALVRAVGRPDRITVASAGGVELVPIAEIVAVVGADDYVELRLIGGRTVLHSARIGLLEQDLSPAFLRIHRSVLVSLAHLERLEREGGRNRVWMANGETLPVSRSRLQALRGALEGNAQVF